MLFTILQHAYEYDAIKFYFDLRIGMKSNKNTVYEHLSSFVANTAAMPAHFLTTGHRHCTITASPTEPGLEIFWKTG
jgi:hypothetical protein